MPTTTLGSVAYSQEHYNSCGLAESDSAAYEIIKDEHARQQKELGLVASANIASLAVMQAMGSTFINTDTEGYSSPMRSSSHMMLRTR